MCVCACMCLCVSARVCVCTCVYAGERLQGSRQKLDCCRISDSRRNTGATF